MLVFASDRFRPYLPDACQVNPNVLGFELAEWLSRELARRGVPTSYPEHEDWGWFLERTEGNAEYMICCSGEATEHAFAWRIFVTQPKKLFRRRPPSSRSDEILALVHRVLQDAAIDVHVEEDP